MTVRQLEKARAFLGLLLLHVVNQSFSADMYAMMTCARIPLQGKVEWKMVKGRRRPVHVLPDADAAKRKSLRRFLDHLTTMGILRNVHAEYLDLLNTQDVKFLNHVPPAGIICWSGIIHVKRPKGEKTSKMYALASFQPSKYPNDILSQFVKPEKVHSTIRETCLRELSTVYNSLQELQEANKLGHEHEFAAKLEPIVKAPLESTKTAQIAYVLTCFARPRGLVKLLPSAVRLALTAIPQ